jgi:DNA-binding GntR family transcriptional regulator
MGCEDREMNEISAQSAGTAAVPVNLDNDQIYARVFEAIVDHRLMPGTHLKEDELCEIFGIGRTRLRAILSRLSADHIVELVANRGAFVSKPTIDEAREVFRARRLIEGHLVRRAAENPTEKVRVALMRHLGLELAAREAGDQSIVIRRCGKFHQVLGEQAESPIMARFLRELIARSSLIVAIYEAKAPEECEMDEHRALTELVLASRADAAVELMERHLHGIEERLDLQPRRQAHEDLRTTLIGSQAPVRS